MLNVTPSFRPIDITQGVNMSKDYVSIVSPKGIAIYPWLTKCDTKFNPLGEYKVSLSVDAEEATLLMGKIDGVIEEAKKLIPEGKKQKEADAPYFMELNDDGAETGRVVFKFKMKAKIVTKDGRNIEMTPKLFDASGALLNDCPDVWGGSMIRVSADLIPFYVAAVGSGVSLRMKAVQVIELKTGGGADASSFGFGKEEGYEAPQQQAEQNDFVDEDDQEDF